MNVDIEEMNKQKKDMILKSGKYVEINILVPRDDGLEPITEFNCNKCSSIEVAKTIKCMKALEETLYKKDPFLKMIVSLMVDEYIAYEKKHNDNTITKL